jgi:hypothetical protein
MGIPVVRAVLLAVLLLQIQNARQSQSGMVKGVVRTSKGLPVEGMRVAVEPVDNVLDAGVLESMSLTESLVIDGTHTPEIRITIVP